MILVKQAQKAIEVLYIEDNKGDIRLLKEALKEARLLFHVEAAADGIEALLRVNQLGRFAEKERPDLILLDLGLPRLDGFKVLNEIRNNPLLNPIPILVLSGSKDQADVEAARNLKADLFITKPSDINGYWNVAKEIEDYWLVHHPLHS